MTLGFTKVCAECADCFRLAQQGKHGFVGCDQEARLVMPGFHHAVAA